MAKTFDELLASLKTSAPRVLDGAVHTLAQSIVLAGQVQWVPVRPLPHSKKSECFFNVREQESRQGGDLVYGWTIWEWPGVFVEAEHHAVWRSSEGELIDITPHVPHHDKIAFLPDPAATFDWSVNTVRANIRHAIFDHEAVHTWFEAVDARKRYAEAHKKDGMVGFERTHWDALLLEDQLAKLKIFQALAKDKSRSSPCVCGSGRKFKRCCEPLFASKAIGSN